MSENPIALYPNPCPICTSPYRLFVQDVFGRRTQQYHKQYFCMDCQSFTNPSGYRESEEQQRLDFEFLFNERERHSALLSQLCLEIRTRAPGVQSVCEIGFGIGLMMRACRDFGMTTYGYELNPFCHKFAKEELGLDCELGYFREDSPRTYDAMISCMVFEHLEDPRKLFADMRDHLNPDGIIYLTVPFAHRNEWRYLWTASSGPADMPPDIFYDNDVHITHFSVEGMKKMGLGLGARSAEYWVSKDTYDHSPGSYHGVLFRF